MTFLGGIRRSLLASLLNNLPETEQRALIPAWSAAAAQTAALQSDLLSAEGAAAAASVAAERKLAQLQQHALADALAAQAAAAASLAKAKAAAKPSTHAVFGKLVLDLGHSRVFACEASKLCDARLIPVWEHQRLFRAERSAEIALSKKRNRRFARPAIVLSHSDINYCMFLGLSSLISMKILGT